MGKKHSPSNRIHQRNAERRAKAKRNKKQQPNKFESKWFDGVVINDNPVEYNKETERIAGLYIFQDGELAREILTKVPAEATNTEICSYFTGITLTKVPKATGSLAVRFPNTWSNKVIKDKFVSDKWGVYSCSWQHLCANGTMLVEAEEFERYMLTDYSTLSIANAPLMPICQDIDSSVIKRVIYDRESETLHLDFVNGSGYEYSNVPYYKVESLINSSSAGRYFNYEIRDEYAYEKVA